MKKAAGAAGAAGIVEEDTVVKGRSVRTRLTSGDLVVEPGPTAERFQWLSDEGAVANDAVVGRVTGPQVGGRGGTTLASHKTLLMAERALTEMEVERSRG